METALGESEASSFWGEVGMVFQTIWQNVSPGRLIQLIEGMPNRLQATIDTNSYSTLY
jgi:hypothetical protein